MEFDDQDLEQRIAGASRFGRVVHVRSCTSTQDLAAADPGADDAVFWTDHQTAGRGRQQRPWHDEAGADLAVTFRVHLRLPTPMALPLAVPLCVLEAVEPLLDRAAGALRLKWPNDVLLGGRKLAGVLIDAGSGGSERFLIGVGVNVNTAALPPELSTIATSLRIATGAEHDRRRLLLALASAMHRAFRALEADDLASLVARFRDRLDLIGRRVIVRCGEVATGRLSSLDVDALRLDDGRSFPLGQVRELRADG